MFPAAILVLCIPGSTSIGTTYFVSKGGNDSSSGRSSAQAWKTLDRVSSASLKPGDRVVFAAGDTFTGTLTLEEGGTKTQPITLESTGIPAVLMASGMTGIHIKSGGIILKNLTLKGQAQATQPASGIWLEAQSSGQLNSIRLENLDISGFGKDGITISGAFQQPLQNGFSDVQILNCRSYNNFGNGLFIWDSLPMTGKRDSYAHKDFIIRDCEFSNNFGGNGIIISGLEGGLVEFCRASGNRRPKKVSLGMWTYCAKNVIFRHCIANGTRGDDDGNGFDLDGGSVNCRILHCLSFDNDSAGYMHCDYPSAPKTTGNVISHSISINDGRNPNGRHYGFGFSVWGSGLYDCTIENSAVFITKPSPKNPELGALWATFLRDESTPLESQRLEGAVFRNNLVQIDVAGPTHAWENIPARNRDLAYIDNRYMGSQPPSFFIESKGADKINLEQWLNYTKEKISKTSRIKVPENLELINPRDLPNWLKFVGMPN